MEYKQEFPLRFEDSQEDVLHTCKKRYIQFSVVINTIQSIKPIWFRSRKLADHNKKCVYEGKTASTIQLYEISYIILLSYCYIYICVCVCVCVCDRLTEIIARSFTKKLTHSCENQVKTPIHNTSHSETLKYEVSTLV
jgi:hypothetical protein